LRRALLGALEAGQPVTLQGRNLHRHMNLRRDQSFHLFTVTPDDRVTPSLPSSSPSSS
jgi:hypothetical protein